MKYLDKVRVTASKEEYEKEGVFKGAEGTIIISEIRSNTYEVVFSRRDGSDYAQILIYAGDLEVVQSSDITDEDILEDLPLHDPNWWCVVATRRNALTLAENRKGSQLRRLLLSIADARSSIV